MGEAAYSKARWRAPVIDGLNCATQSRDQWERTIAGRVSTIDLTCLRPAHDLGKAMSDIGLTLRMVAVNSDIAEIVTSVREIRGLHETGKLGIILGAQNSTCVEHDLSLLRVLQRIGFRILQPTYMEQNRLGSGVLAKEAGGLTELGYEWVALMNELRMQIDLAHVGYRTAFDAAKASKHPVIVSHGNPRAMCDTPRNIPDELIRAVVATGGTIGATLWPPMLRLEERPTLEDFYRHVDYLVNLVGIDHVTFGSDLSERTKTASQWEVGFGPRGMYPEVSAIAGPWFTFEQRFTKGYESLADTGRILDGLHAHGYSEGEVDKVMGGNLLRVLEEVWGE